MTNFNTLEINEVLFNIDPMNVGSVENNLENEYMTRADGINQLISENMKLEDAIKKEFEYAFWEGCLDKETIKQIVDELNK